MFFRNPIQILLDGLVKKIESTLDTKLGQFMSSISEQLSALSEAQAVTSQNITNVLFSIQSELEQFKQIFEDILNDQSSELEGELLDRVSEAVDKQVAMNAQLQSVIEAVNNMSETTQQVMEPKEDLDPSEP